MKINQGLTLIETLVAISILMLAITSALTLADKSLDSSAYAKDQVTAIYLAQEGMELVHNLRDNNFITGNSWLAGLDSCIDGKCFIGASSGGVGSCSTTCPLLWRHKEAGLYGYTETADWEETIYRRDITINQTGYEEAQVTVTVTWSNGGPSRSYEVKETIFNWYE